MERRYSVMCMHVDVLYIYINFTAIIRFNFILCTVLSETLSILPQILLYLPVSWDSLTVLPVKFLQKLLWFLNDLIKLLTLSIHLWQCYKNASEHIKGATLSQQSRSVCGGWRWRFFLVLRLNISTGHFTSEQI